MSSIAQAARIKELERLVTKLLEDVAMLKDNLAEQRLKELEKRKPGRPSKNG
jgi:hypothetical protein